MPNLKSSNIVRSFSLSSVALLATLLGMGVGYLVLLSTEWGAILGGIALAGSVVGFACAGELHAARVVLFVSGTSLAGAGMTDLLNFPESNSDVLPGAVLGLVTGLLLARAIWGRRGHSTSGQPASGLPKGQSIVASLVWASLWMAILLVWDDEWTADALGWNIGSALIGAVVLIAQLVRYKRHGSRLSRAAKWIDFTAMLATILYITIATGGVVSLDEEVAPLLFFFTLLAGIVFWMRKYGQVEDSRAPASDFKQMARRSAVLMSFMVPVTVLGFYSTQAVFNLAVNVSPTEWVAMGDDTPLGAPFRLGNERFVRLMMNDLYYWQPRNDAKMTTPEKFIRDLAVDRWSYAVTTKENNDHEAGIGEDVGIIAIKKGAHNIVAYVDHNSPAARAGIKRGDRYIRRSVKPERHKFDEVLHHVIRKAGGNIGYLWILDFSEEAERELDGAFDEFRGAGVKELVIDLRYNPGGLLPVKLASLIAGGKHDGAVIWHLAYSDKYQDKNEDQRLSNLRGSIPIERVFVLTTGDSCSASEAIINGLRPYLPVITIGQKTCGKPYAMQEINYDGFVFSPVLAKTYNSQGKADYEHGIKPDCEVKETFSHPVDQPGDALLDTALYYEKHNACPSVL